MKLKNGLRVLWREAGRAQIGCDPQVALVVELEHPAEFDILQSLEGNETPARLRGQLEEAGGRRERVDQLLTELGQANLLQTGAVGRSPELEIEPTRRDLLAAEGDSRVLMDSNGWRGLVRRGRQRVAVYGLGRTGAQLALGLATAGVGGLDLVDDRPVAPRDRGAVFAREHVGRTRAEAVADAIRSRELDCSTRVGPRPRRPDAVVLVDYEVSDPNRSAFMSAHKIPHLSVVVGELDITCGPWVAVRGGACLRCVRLWSVDADPRWPTLATQRFSRSAVAARGEDSSLAAIAAGFAVGQVLQGLGGGSPFTAGRIMTCSLPTYAIGWRGVDPHPHCDHHGDQANSKPRGQTPPPPLIPLPPAN